MAFFTDTLRRDAGLLERTFSSLSHRLSETADMLARRRVGRVTYTELAQLSDRELNDLGLIRADLQRIAREAAEGKL